jgi:hypothetical protein
MGTASSADVALAMRAITARGADLARVALLLSTACSEPNPAYRSPRLASPAPAEDAGASGGRGATDAGRPDLRSPLPDAPAFASPDASPAVPDASSTPGLDAAPVARAPSALLAFWSFDERDTGGVVPDSSGNGYPGTLENITPAMAWVTSQRGVALSVPPIASASRPPRVRVAPTAALDALRAFTISAWFYRTAVPANTHDSIISRQLGEGNAEVFNLTCNNHDLIIYIPAVTPGMGSQVTFEARAPDICVRDRWVHAAATYDGRWLRLFADGKEVASRDFPDRLRPAPGKPVYIGANQNMGFTETFEGWLDDVALFSVALPATDVQRLAGGTSPLDL